jgi:hypothetical protein
VRSDTVITFLWERGDGTDFPYVSPFTGETVNIMVIVNSPTLWTDDIAAISRDVILENGEYEITITEADVYNNESGHSQPLFIDVVKAVARVQINLRLR